MSNDLTIEWRAAFEDEAKKLNPRVELIQKRGKYINSVVEMRWEGFQMACELIKRKLECRV